MAAGIGAERMTGQRSGWITARSQIAFVVGLVIAVGVIFWLELVQFRNADDPMGDSWVVALDVPAWRIADDARPAWLDTAIATVAAGDDPVASALVAAACSRSSICDAAPDASSAALTVLASSPAPWDAVRGPVALVALSALLADTADPAVAAAWAAAQGMAEGLGATSIPSEFGLRQFAARAATLAGRDFAAARRLTELRDVFEPADGLRRIGLARATELALGLGLLDAMFPDTGAIRQLLWRTYADWPAGIADAPLSVIALWWSAFGIGGLEEEISSRMATAGALEAGIAVLALTSAGGRGPLLGASR